MIYPHTKVLERRKEVASLMVRGLTPSEIAEVLGISRDTVYNDIREIRSGKHDALSIHAQKEMVSHLLLNARERTRSLWRIADGAESEYIQLLALKELRIQDQAILKNLSKILRATGPQDQWQTAVFIPRVDSEMPETPHKNRKESVNFRPNPLSDKRISVQDADKVPGGHAQNAVVSKEESPSREPSHLAQSTDASTSLLTACFSARDEIATSSAAPPPRNDNNDVARDETARDGGPETAAIALDETGREEYNENLRADDSSQHTEGGADGSRAY